MRKCMPWALGLLLHCIPELLLVEDVDFHPHPPKGVFSLRVNRKRNLKTQEFNGGVGNLSRIRTDDLRDSIPALYR